MQYAEVWAVPLRVWQFVMDPELLIIVHKPYLVPVLALLCLFPFAAMLVRRRPVDAPWAFLEPPGELHTPRLSVRPFQPLVIGATAGAVFLALVVVIPIQCPQRRQRGDAGDGRRCPVVLRRSRRARHPRATRSRSGRGVARGLVWRARGGLVAGSLGWLGIAGGPAAGGCIDQLSLNLGPCAWVVSAGFSWDVFKQVVAEGAIAGLAGGIVSLGVRALVRRRHGAEELHPAKLAG